MTTEKITTLPIAALIEDYDLYPRHHVDTVYASRLAAALEAGTTLPPLIVEKKTKRLVDGWHRLRAIRKVFGDSATVSVVERNYPDEAALLADAVRYNIAHGRLLDNRDLARSAWLLEAVGFPSEQIAVQLQVPEQKLQRLMVRVVSVKNGKDHDPVVLKASTLHLDDGISREQAEAIERQPGTPHTLIAMQLREAIVYDLVNEDNPRLRSELTQLLPVLEEWVSAHPVEEAA